MGWRGNQNVEGRSLYLFADLGVVDHQFQTKALDNHLHQGRKLLFPLIVPVSPSFPNTAKRTAFLAPNFAGCGSFPLKSVLWAQDT